MCPSEPLAPAPPTAGLVSPADLILLSSLPSFTFYGEDSPRARFVSSPAAQLGGFAEHMLTASAANILCQVRSFFSTTKNIVLLLISTFQEFAKTCNCLTGPGHRPEFPSSITTESTRVIFYWWRQYVKGCRFTDSILVTISPNIGVLFASERKSWITRVNIAAS
jgi:hypothetical protein